MLLPDERVGGDGGELVEVVGPERPELEQLAREYRLQVGQRPGAHRGHGPSPEGASDRARCPFGLAGQQPLDEVHAFLRLAQLATQAAELGLERIQIMACPLPTRRSSHSRCAHNPKASASAACTVACSGWAAAAAKPALTRLTPLSTMVSGRQSAGLNLIGPEPRGLRRVAPRGASEPPRGSSPRARARGCRPAHGRPGQTAR